MAFTTYRGLENVISPSIKLNVILFYNLSHRETSDVLIPDGTCYSWELTSWFKKDTRTTNLKPECELSQAPNGLG